MKQLDVVIVGAGPAGVGTGVVLRDLKVGEFALVDRHEVGGSFLRWPREMRLLTPSFPGQGFGAMDLNAIAIATSPAFTLEQEHPSGAEYARYLKGVANHWELPVQTGVDVTTVEPLPEGGFRLQTSAGELRSRFVVWAAGEFQYPDIDIFPGADLCRHNGQVASWQDIEGEEAIVIGGYESGIDAAIHLSALGKRVRVLDGAAPWEARFGDPSRSLSPYTRARLKAALGNGRIELTNGGWVERVERTPTGYAVCCDDDRVWTSSIPPILATGFMSGVYQIADLFEWHEGGWPNLTERDESTRTPGLFLVGPSVRHETAIFCFIYKFRQRFAVVADAIAERLGLDQSPLETYRREGMFLDDLSCCGTDCVC